jgi:hypothetical protein
LNHCLGIHVVSDAATAAKNFVHRASLIQTTAEELRQKLGAPTGIQGRPGEETWTYTHRRSHAKAATNATNER